MTGPGRALAAVALALSATALAPTGTLGTQDALLAARTRGSANAPVTVYEMSDFQCPWCARFFRETLPHIEREYVRTGRVRFIFVNLPLSIHRNATPAAELAMCAAAQGKFWEVHDLLFRHQERWASLDEPGTYFLGLADSARADRDRIVRCLQNGEMREVVRQDAVGAYRSGARSTPSFYIEGGLLSGAQPIEVFRQVLDSIIAERAARR
ncbi:MAG TPA: thioredoxin domain-containing protein [Gemmatimonadales bacterium]|nr:thioredoxin domain-containing protein [Gemmatimonadales bacterium]